MGYAWTITVDKADNGNDVGVVGPGNATLTAEQIKEHPERNAFKMYDADGELYYQGFFVGDASSEDAFGPLDDFGTPNAGATRIDYRDKAGAYQTL